MHRPFTFAAALCAFDFRFFGRRREARERQATKPDKHGVRTQNELVCGPPTFFGGLRDSRNPILQSSRKPLCRNALLLVIVGLSQVGAQGSYGKIGNHFPLGWSDSMRAFVLSPSLSWSTADGISGRELCHAPSSQHLFPFPRAQKKEQGALVGFPSSTYLLIVDLQEVGESRLASLHLPSN